MATESLEGPERSCEPKTIKSWTGSGNNTEQDVHIILDIASNGRGSLAKTRDVSALHDGLVAMVDMNAQEDTNGIVATIHIVCNMLL